MGKKKKSQLEKKPRIAEMLINMYPGWSLEITPKLNNQVIEMLVRKNDGPKEKVEIDFKTYYEGEGRKKYINQVAYSAKGFSPDPDHVLGKYDVIYAVDTNLLEYRDNRIHICSIVKGERFKEQIICVPWIGFEFWGCRYDKPEKVGWAALIHCAQRGSLYEQRNKIGIIVDSDFGNIKSYNRRELPILDDIFLPEKFELNYATADKPEFFINRMLKLADKTANELKEAIAHKIEEDSLNPEQDNTGKDNVVDTFFSNKCSFHRTWFSQYYLEALKLASE